MTPEEIAAQFLPPRYFQGGTYDNLRSQVVDAIRSYGVQCAMEERVRGVEALKGLLWAVHHDLAWAFYQPYEKRVQTAIDRAIAAIRNQS